MALKTSILITFCTLVSSTALYALDWNHPKLQKFLALYAVEEIKNVETVEYRFRVQIKDKSVNRKWTWWPKADKIKMEQEGKETVEYSRQSQLEQNKKTDSAFINDNYWLLFPWRIYVDSSVTLSWANKEESSLLIQYPHEGGYTPGDAYTLHFDKNMLITSWDFDAKGDGKIDRSMSWEGYQKLGPLLISTQHKAEDFHLWFEDLRLKLSGDSDWKTPTPYTAN